MSALTPKRSRLASIAAAASLCVFGCTGAAGTPTDVELGRSNDPLTVTNGRDLNGRDLNGRDLNGRDLNGRDLNGRDLNGRDLNGRPLVGPYVDLLALTGQLNGQAVTSAWTAGSELVLVTAAGSLVRGTQVVGATFKPKSATSDTEGFRIDAVQTGSGLFTYSITVGLSANGIAVCGTDSTGTPLGALLLDGVWDSSEGPGGGAYLSSDTLITLACPGYALYKCVQAGYRPWESTTQRARHQACTRLLRADYCGDGRSHTENGRWVNLYDGAGIQTDTEDWIFEAEWNADGARCVSSMRSDGGTVVDDCARPLQDKSCGKLSHFRNSDTLLMNEYMPR